MDGESILSLKSSQSDGFNKFNVNKNFSFIIDTIPDVIRTEANDLGNTNDKEYEQFLADVWVGIVLTLMVLSCVCCMCSCLLYHKFQQWKRSVIEAQSTVNVENGSSISGSNNNQDAESLPSYTIVSGLPTYEEALEQLKEIREQTASTYNTSTTQSSTTTPTITTSQQQQSSNMQQLSVKDLFQMIKPTNLDIQQRDQKDN